MCTDSCYGDLKLTVPKPQLLLSRYLSLLDVQIDFCFLKPKKCSHGFCFLGVHISGALQANNPFRSAPAALLHSTEPLTTEKTKTIQGGDRTEIGKKVFYTRRYQSLLRMLFFAFLCLLDRWQKWNSEVRHMNVSKNSRRIWGLEVDDPGAGHRQIISNTERKTQGRARRRD